MAVCALSCSGAPHTNTAAAAQPQKQQKTRQVVVQVPVLVKETSFYADGLVDEYVIYKYDANLLLLVEKDTFDAARPDPIERLVTETAAGRVSAETTFDADGKIKLRREMTYDDLGRETAERILDLKGVVQSSSSYDYDADGNRLEWKVFDGKGALRAFTRYTYEKGRNTLIDMRDGSGAVTGTISVEYDASGLPVKRSYKAPDGSIQKYEAMIYDAGRLVGQETRYADGSLASKATYTNGDLGQVLTAVTTDAAGAVKDRRTFEYSVRQDQKTEVYWE
jgi:antitoxin component YwqK of YwqJK toxin-antitoxin module